MALPQDQRLQPRLATLPLGDPNQQGILAAELVEMSSDDLLRASQLSLASVDEQNIGHLVRRLLLTETALQGLSHRRIIISTGDAADVKAPVFTAERPLAIEDQIGRAHV